MITSTLGRAGRSAAACAASAATASAAPTTATEVAIATARARPAIFGNAVLETAVLKTALQSCTAAHSLPSSCLPAPVRTPARTSARCISALLPYEKQSVSPIPHQMRAPPSQRCQQGTYAATRRLRRQTKTVAPQTAAPPTPTIPAGSGTGLILVVCVAAVALSLLVDSL